LADLPATAERDGLVYAEQLRFPHTPRGEPLATDDVGVALLLLQHHHRHPVRAQIRGGRRAREPPTHDDDVGVLDAHACHLSQLVRDRAGCRLAGLKSVPIVYATGTMHTCVTPAGMPNSSPTRRSNGRCMRVIVLPSPRLRSAS